MGAPRTRGAEHQRPPYSRRHKTGQRRRPCLVCLQGDASCKLGVLDLALCCECLVLDVDLPLALANYSPAADIGFFYEVALLELETRAQKGLDVKPHTVIALFFPISLNLSNLW